MRPIDNLQDDICPKQGKVSEVIDFSHGRTETYIRYQCAYQQQLCDKPCTRVDTLVCPLFKEMNYE